MITDTHIHFCAADRLGELTAFMERAGIDRAGLVSLPSAGCGNYNSAVLAAVKAAPQQFIGFGCLDHRLERTESGGAEQVRRLSMAGFAGLKLWIGSPAAELEFGIRMEDEYITGALKAAAETGMPVLLHLADPPDFWDRTSANFRRLPGTFNNWIDRGTELFKRFPDATFIGAHLLFLAGGLPKLESIMHDCPNLMLDTAPGRWFFRKLAEKRAEAEGFFNRRADRILFGSDSMFFPPDFTAFHPGSIAENIRTADRIHRFIGSNLDGRAAVMRIDDPYPWSDYRSDDAPGRRMLPCLRLETGTIKKITCTNADRFFGHYQ